MNEIMLQEASLQGFVRTILIIVGVYYAFKFLMRLLAPYLMKKMVEKAGANFKQQYQQYQHYQQQQQPNYSSKTRDESTASSTEKNPRSTKKIGEYIDYEEID